MAQFSLLVHVHKPSPILFQRMLASVEVQTYINWELVLVVSAGHPADEAAARSLAAVTPNVRVELRPAGELLSGACNALAPSLGSWIGFLGQHDQLRPDALAQMQGMIAGNPVAKVVYSDEEALGTWGQVSLPFSKGAIDPLRLPSQDYLRDLVLIQRTWFQAAGGFDRQASDQPRHDFYLRTLESLGVAAFAHNSERLYRRHRNRLTESRPFLPAYDLDGARRHYERIGVQVKVKQINGTLDTDFQFEHHPSVTVLLVVGDDVNRGKARLAGIGLLPIYQPWAVRALFTGQSAEAFARYVNLCRGHGYALTQIGADRPTALNQEASSADTDLVLFLEGVPLNARWLQRLVNLTQLPGIFAAGPTLITPLHQQDGSPWNSRGSFNHLSVPHSVSMLPPQCLLVDTRKFLELGGFDPAYPTLYAEDFSLRLAALGHGCGRTPQATIQMSPGAAAEPEELTAFRTAWAGWEDPYLLHQLP